MVSIFNRIKKYNNCDNRHHYLLTRGNKTVELFGEDHAVDYKDSYKNMINVIMESKKKPLVLVEHSTSDCHLKDKTAEELNPKTGGSETMFIKLHQKKYSNIRCIDNRFAKGFMLMSQYYRILEELKKYKHYQGNDIPGTMIRDIANTFMEIMVYAAKLVDRNNSLHTEINQYFDDSIYNNVYNEFKNTIKKQIPILKLAVESLLKGAVEPDYFKHFIQNAIDLTNNLERVASLLVDVSILSNIADVNDQYIIIYAGIAHTDRIAAYLKQVPSMMAYLSNNIVETPTPTPSRSRSRSRSHSHSHSRSRSRSRSRTHNRSRTRNINISPITTRANTRTRRQKYHGPSINISPIRRRTLVGGAHDTEPYISAQESRKPRTSIKKSMYRPYCLPESIITNIIKNI